MGHPSIENRTPFAFEALFLADEEGRPLLVPVVKATYRIVGESRLELAEKQVPVNPAGEHWGDPEKTSCKYEPETAFVKPATDVVLIGHAHAPRSGVTQVDTALRAGPVQKVVRVFGERFWLKSMMTFSMSRAYPFEKIPLVYERAFGGWDRGDPDPGRHTFDPRNPVGTGFLSSENHFKDGIRLPNLEDPGHPISDIKDRPDPAGFGFVPGHWHPRSALAGTYDKAWMEGRMPLLPRDFDRRFFNAAPRDQVAPGYLRGDEPVTVIGVSPAGRTSFSLPGIPAPHCRVAVRNMEDRALATRLDTLIINMDENLVFILWRANLVLRNGPHDVIAMQVGTEGAAA